MFIVYAMYVSPDRWTSKSETAWLWPDYWWEYFSYHRQQHIYCR